MCISISCKRQVGDRFMLILTLVVVFWKNAIRVILNALFSPRSASRDNFMLSSVACSFYLKILHGKELTVQAL